ncbi:MAG: type II and III secretion system protein family protein [Alphaproteobacteria bacterium]
MKKITTIILMFLALCLSLNIANAAEKFKDQGFKNILNNLFPKERIEIHNVKNSVVLSGNVTNIETASKIEKIAKEYFGSSHEVLNFLHLKSSQQVLLRVKLGEVIKNEGNSFSQSSNFDYLEQKGVIKKIAEPNLVAMSGEEAEFLSGGEVPVPMMNKEGITSISYKPYGIKITFTPLVLSSNRIRLSVEPEISEIIKTDNNQKLPVFSSRRAKTTVELGAGEAFMIAGLVKDYQSNSKRNTSELVISVTPYIVNPMQNKDLHFPTGQIFTPSNLDNKFMEKVNTEFNSSITNLDNAPNGALSLEGPVGFIAE